ncbi:nucleoside monophosphate kinase [Candidatus Pacearchaeota archaeon]|nr:hypothetical protein [uncultured archaeon]MBS3084447.1 nucleoside monophosphate kinase [Candidatus Pacearchaeota archaeon]
MKKLLFIGPPGSGKGTQAKLLEKYGFINLSSGDLIRKSSDSVIVKYKEIEYPRGKLLSDRLIFKLIKEGISKLPRGSTGYILDGFIRTLPQAEYAKKKNLAETALYFSIDEKKAVERILKRNEGRTDDNIISVKKRFDEYRKKTEPILNYLKENFKFYEIDAGKTIEEINGKVLGILGLKN